jgi:hypothetical protein
MKLTIINATPNEVRIFRGDVIVHTYPPGEYVARAEQETIPIVTPKGSPCPWTITRFVVTDELPPPKDGTLYIVSPMYAQASPHRRDLLIPATASNILVDEEGDIVVGYREFQRPNI